MTDAGGVVEHGTGHPDGSDGSDALADLADLADLTAAVHGAIGFDLTGYRGDTVLRRARARARRRPGTPELGDYATALVGDVAEARALLDEVHVQRSGWFRDRTVWRLLAAQVLPSLVAGTAADRPLRAWSAGCGDGREVWSLASLLAEVAPGSWQLLASDVSARALLTTAEAVYPGAPGSAPGALAAWATAHSGGWRVAEPLRDRVTLVRHDVRDAAPHEVEDGCDLVLCRNVLMYLDEATQRVALGQLTTSLRPGGALVLGAAEAALDQRDVLVPVDLAARVYRLIATRVAPPPPTGG